MEQEVLYKNNPWLESKKRLNMAYLLAENPKMIDTITNKSACFFHGTNANALPNILKYGMNSVNKSIESNIEINTGEEWSRINGKRSFISLTDCLDIALKYAHSNPININSSDTLLNFGIIIGTSLKDMKDVNAFSINSDIPEVGIDNHLSLDHIKFLAVPENNLEFVKKIVGQKDIDIIAMDIDDPFYNNNYNSKLKQLKYGKDSIGYSTPLYPIYHKEDIKPIVNERSLSGIKNIFNTIKEKLFSFTKKTDEKNIDER